VFAQRRAKRWARGPKRTFPHKYFRTGEITRQRERRFVDELAARVVLAFPDLASLRPERIRPAIRRLAVAALPGAGYFPRGVTRVDGEVKTPARRQADYLLGMPRIQQALATKLEAAGLSVDRALLEAANIATGHYRVREQALTKDGTVVELERDIAPSDRLRALELTFRLTTGFAPTKTFNANTQVGPDALFDEGEFSKAPPIDAVEQEPKNVTPRKGGRR
jgi:hypothetical protein